VVDFDGTCTEHDTTPVLPHLAEAHAPSGSGGGPSKLARFSDLEQDYLRGMEEINSRHGLASEAPPPPDTGLDLRGLEAFLAEADAHSTAITNKASASGCLAGIRADDVAGTLAKWSSEPEHAPFKWPPPPQLRLGCAQTLALAQANGCKMGVLSVNWCPPMIRALLTPSCDFTLWSNSLDEDGRVSLSVGGAAEKRATIRRLQEAAASAGEGPVVYVGDSSTDLTALLEADIGFLIGESSSARRVARRYGVVLRPLSCWGGSADDNDDQVGSAALGVVWEAQSWADIARCLLGQGAYQDEAAVASMQADGLYGETGTASKRARVEAPSS